MDELRGEQDIAQAYEKEQKLLECQIKGIQQRHNDADTNALKGGKKAIYKIDTRICESELDAEKPSIWRCSQKPPQVWEAH